MPVMTPIRVRIESKARRLTGVNSVECPLCPTCHQSIVGVEFDEEAAVEPVAYVLPANDPPRQPAFRNPAVPVIIDSALPPPIVIPDLTGRLVRNYFHVEYHRRVEAMPISVRKMLMARLLRQRYDPTRGSTGNDTYVSDIIDSVGASYLKAKRRNRVSARVKRAKKGVVPRPERMLVEDVVPVLVEAEGLDVQGADLDGGPVGGGDLDGAAVRGDEEELAVGVERRAGGAEVVEAEVDLDLGAAGVAVAAELPTEQSSASEPLVEGLATALLCL